MGLGTEPKRYKIISYNQLSPEEVLESNYPIEKLVFWDVTASLPGKSASESPHLSVYWYGPRVSSDKGFVVRMKSVKLDDKYVDPIRAVVASAVGGEQSTKEGALEFKNFTMKISYTSIANLARNIEKVGRLATETTLEFGMVTKEERENATIPKTKVLGEKPIQE